MIAIPTQFDVKKDDWYGEKLLLPDGSLVLLRFRGWTVATSFPGCHSCLALQLTGRTNAYRYCDAGAEHLLCVNVAPGVWPALKIKFIERSMGWNAFWTYDGSPFRAEVYERIDFGRLL
jgi:hypothetical protein